MDLKHLIAVEKWTLALAALAIASSLLVLGRRIGFGVSLGATLMAVNAYAMRRIGQKVLTRFKRPGAALLLFNLKMAALIALIFVIIKYLPIDPIGLIIGVSVFPLAIVAVAVQHGLRDAKSDEESHG